MYITTNVLGTISFREQNERSRSDTPPATTLGPPATKKQYRADPLCQRQAEGDKDERCPCNDYWNVWDRITIRKTLAGDSAAAVRRTVAGATNSTAVLVVSPFDCGCSAAIFIPRTMQTRAKRLFKILTSAWSDTRLMNDSLGKQRWRRRLELDTNLPRISGRQIDSPSPKRRYSPQRTHRLYDRWHGMDELCLLSRMICLFLCSSKSQRYVFDFFGHFTWKRLSKPRTGMIKEYKLRCFFVD